MLETLLEHPFFLNRHRDAPLLDEREVFLKHLQQQGTSRVALRNLSGELIHVVRLLQMEKLQERYQWRDGIYDEIQELMPLQGGLSIERMCQLAGVSRASFYRFLQERAPVEEDLEVRSVIQQKHWQFRPFPA